ncbi:MAG: formamidopyrimidine-DNA glycosylase [Saprospiraceae bacterium]|nr:MAG: formamidopyrimidine-DNA glycosylase [Saprospiraceae bacterium]
MPELPEVNTFQRYFEATSLHQKIREVEVYDEKIIRNVSGLDFIERLEGRIFTGTSRRGKYLFVNLDNGHHVQLHFGMTGDIKYYSEPEDRPRHERFVFHFDSGFRLGFDCPRKFARICYIENLEDYLADIGLGEDALMISEAEFLQKMEGKKNNIKGFLLNQKYIAGVGNLYADEICYQTRIHPASSVKNLSTAQCHDVFQKMRAILTKAIEQSAHYKEYPENWFWAWRKEGFTRPDGLGVVKSTKIAGRTTYYCEGWQVLY